MKKRGSEIKALIFDMGGVVVFYDHRIAAKKMSKLTSVPSKKIFNVLNGAHNTFTKTYELGKPTYWKIAAKNLGIKKIPGKKFDRFWTTIFWPNQKLISFMKKLKKKYRIAIISNTGALHKNYLSKKYNLNKLTTKQVYSYKLGIQKPHPKIYRVALKKLNVKPEEAIFIDDRLENVNGAKKFGMKGIVFKNNKQAIREIEKILKIKIQNP
jgi:putative hydrolase of the HAD superfamily